MAIESQNKTSCRVVIVLFGTESADGFFGKNFGLDFTFREGGVESLNTHTNTN